MNYSNNNISTVVCSSSIKISRLRLKKTNCQNISALTIETEFLCTIKNKKPRVVTISNQLQATYRAFARRRRFRLLSRHFYCRNFQAFFQQRVTPRLLVSLIRRPLELVRLQRQLKHNIRDINTQSIAMVTSKQNTVHPVTRSKPTKG